MADNFDAQISNYQNYINDLKRNQTEKIMKHQQQSLVEKKIKRASKENVNYFVDGR